MAKAKEELREDSTPVSSEKARFATLIEAYKKQNPVKFEKKREALEKKLASL